MVSTRASLYGCLLGLLGQNLYGSLQQYLSNKMGKISLHFTLVILEISANFFSNVMLCVSPKLLLGVEQHYSSKD